jgi:two-component system phosphate regulon response regulator PhoB
MTTGRLLVVEDEPSISELISINLRHAGFTVVTAATAEAAREVVDRELPGLVVLDWMLPDRSGIALCRQWRSESRTRDLPVIMLTARAEEADQVQGLEAGADDYLVKPFSPRTLVARVRAVLRRRSPQALDDAVQIGALKLDPSTRRVTCQVSGVPMEIRLGPTELLDRVWGDHVFIEERTVDVHIKRLREALSVADCAGMVETVRGAGYRLAALQQAVVG